MTARRARWVPWTLTVLMTFATVGLALVDAQPGVSVWLPDSGGPS